MERQSSGQTTFFAYFLACLRKCIFMVLSSGPLPRHIAFIMDGNRRFCKKNNLMEGAGHRVGFSALMSMLKYCYEFRVKYVTIYAFSIDNFRRRPEEVQSVMDLMQEKIEGLTKEESIVNQYGVKVRFVGNLQMLNKPVRLAAERAMVATANNSKAVLTICVAYTSTDEILHAVRESCEEKRYELNALEATGSGPYGLLGPNNNEKEQEELFIDLSEIEKHMYVTPDPDIIVRTSGETRLSNFLLWQSSVSLLYSPLVLWPEIQFWHLVWAVIEFQRNYLYLKGKVKQQ
ncbi:dehydrodolichyl diphosphate synthase CPT3-like [Apium graveolens]|uniref:dehydrodolichyl diphosphate synthase CPT3-like n=1 Tax=Apium graveolens TaxID=4045 RepID=UPI003D7B62DF